MAAFVVEVGLIAYRGFKKATAEPIPHLPLPADYTGAVLIYGALGLLGKTKAEPVAAAVAWGFVVATLLNLWTPQHPASLKGQAQKGAKP